MSYFRPPPSCPAEDLPTRLTPDMRPEAGHPLLFAYGAALLAVAALTGACGTQPATPAQAESTQAEPAYRIDAHRISFSEAQLPKLGIEGHEHQVKSLLNVGDRMDYGDFVWNDDGVPPGKVWAMVDLTGQTISVFRGGHEIGTAVTLYGADVKPTPPGRFKVLAKYKDHWSSIYDAHMPYTLRLTNDGISIHGSDVQRGAATHGCVGLPIDFAKRLFSQMKVGDEVQVLRNARPSLS
jgi:hypothetical protein